MQSTDRFARQGGPSSQDDARPVLMTLPVKHWTNQNEDSLARRKDEMRQRVFRSRIGEGARGLLSESGLLVKDCPLVTHR